MGISGLSSALQPLPTAAQPLASANIASGSVALVNLPPSAADKAATEARIQADTEAQLAQAMTRSVAFQQIGKQLGGATIDLRSAFSAFKESLPADLADKAFGFTAGADGALRVINSEGSLSARESARLNILMNDSSALKSAALHYRDTAIEYVNLDRQESFHTLGAIYQLDADNFAETIDLGAVAAEPKSRQGFDGWLINQLWSKGTRIEGMIDVIA